MNFEPQKFFIGLIDFFSVWLPGALLTYLVQGDVAPWLPDGSPSPAAGVESWAVFLFISYLVGHFIFLAGSMLLDPLYDGIRDATASKQRERRRKGQKTARYLTRRIARTLFKKGQADRMLSEATALKARILGAEHSEAGAPAESGKGLWSSIRWLSEQLLPDEEGQGSPVPPSAVKRPGKASGLSTFSWSLARLAIEHPQPLAIVQRLEADSKFFRSLCVVLAVLAVWAIPTCNPLMFVLALALILPALWRFMELRNKAILEAYSFVIVLEAEERRGRVLKVKPE